MGVFTASCVRVSGYACGSAGEIVGVSGCETNGSLRYANFLTFLLNFSNN